MSLDHLTTSNFCLKMIKPKVTLVNLIPGLLGDVEDIELRIEKYGVNVIPQKPPPSFLQLAWEAIQDPLLIVLCCAAALTIGLSFYHPPPDEAQGRLTLSTVTA